MRKIKIAPIDYWSGGGADIVVDRTCSQSRRRKLRDLYAATSFTIQAPKSLHDFNFSTSPDPPEIAFLDENDLDK
jgi:hypothetical protein